MSNGDGTDHAWAGNVFVAGGAVRGGHILGDYPTDLTPGGSSILSKGRVVPAVPLEAVWNGVAEWFGVAPEHMDSVLPNRANFDSLFDDEELFDVSNG